MNHIETAIIPLLMVILSFFTIINKGDNLESTVHNWNSLKIEPTKTGERRQIVDGETMAFEHLEIHVTTLTPGKAPHGSQTHRDFEELIIVKEGKIKLTIGTEEKILGPGSIALAMIGDEHGISNAGDTNASYYIFKWRTHDFKNSSNIDHSSSLMLDWNDFEFKKTTKGARRHVLRQPTGMLQELEMHVTTLNEGMKSHDQHTHVDEEIILVLKGQVEELIDDQPHKAEAGSLIFLNSNVPHGIRNIGNGPCEYFAIRWIPKN